MAREFGNKGGRSGKPAGRSGGRTGGRSEGRSGEKSAGFSRSGGSRSRDEGRSERPKRAAYGEDRPKRSYGDREDKPKRSYGDRDERPARRSYSDDKPKRSYSGDREDKPKRSYGDRDERPARRSYSDDKPKRSYSGDREERPRRSYGDRDEKPRRSYGDRDEKPRRSYGDRDERPSRGPRREESAERSDRTPRRYMRDEGDAPRKPKREGRPASEGRYAERKPFKGRFDEDAAEETPRARKPKIGADKLSGTTTPRVRIQANIWGQHAVKAAWTNPSRTINALYTTPEELKLFAPVIEEARSAGIHRPEPTLVGREDLDKHLPREAVHQGVAIYAAEPEEIFIQDIITKAKAKKRSVVLILDQVTDPHNVGAIIRSACALGADGIIMQRRHAPELGGVVAKAASGAIEHVMVAYETNLSRSIEALQAEGYVVAGLDERGEQTVDSLKGHERLALVLGSEGPGLRHLVKEHCDLLVKIRMDGPIPSLNVSNAAAVALYAAVA
jgi:23S rRNA (guanosine2251-2'-O)-methyltransferase